MGFLSQTTLIILKEILPRQYVFGVTTILKQFINKQTHTHTHTYKQYEEEREREIISSFWEKIYINLIWVIFGWEMKERNSNYIGKNIWNSKKKEFVGQWNVGG